MDIATESAAELRVHPRRSILDRFKAYVKLVQVWGKLRRFWLTKTRPGYVVGQRARRRGECQRCGACCAIAYRCPHLANHNHCTVYGRRYHQCREFPIDHRDLRYLDKVCGFYFVRERDF